MISVLEGSPAGVFKGGDKMVSRETLISAISVCVDRKNEQVETLKSLYHKGTHIGACGVMVIAVGNGHGNMSSNPGRDWLHFT